MIKNLKPCWYYEKSSLMNTYNIIPNLQTHVYLTYSAENISSYFLVPNQRVKVAHLITEDIQRFLAPEFQTLSAEEVEHLFNFRLYHFSYYNCKLWGCGKPSECGNPLFGHHFCREHGNMSVKKSTDTDRERWYFTCYVIDYPKSNPYVDNYSFVVIKRFTYDTLINLKSSNWLY